MLGWFWTLYEKLVTKDATVQARPVEKAINDKVDKIVGPLVKCVRVVPLTRGQRLALGLAVWAGVALLAWLDAPASGVSLRPTTPVAHAAVFEIIWTGIQILAGWVATVAEVTATYVWIALQWLAGTVGVFLRSAGAMFAKVWDGLKIVWSDVVKPALVWVDDQLKRLQTWLADTFRPVFDFLNDVRTRLAAFYATFVRPVVDTIEFLRSLNRVLLAFHITFLQALDRTLQQIEQRIEEPFLWVNAKLNEIWNALDLVVGADHLFQRLTLIRSMSSYAPQWMRIATNKRMGTLSENEAYRVGANTQPQAPRELVDQTITWWSGEQSDTGDALDAVVQRSLDFFNEA